MTNGEEDGPKRELVAKDVFGLADVAWRDRVVHEEQMVYFSGGIARERHRELHRKLQDSAAWSPAKRRFVLRQWRQQGLL